MSRLLLPILALCVLAAPAFATGPKTVHVRAYTRKDGTHVKEHYRSPPGSGHSSPSTTRVRVPSPPAFEPRISPRTSSRGGVLPGDSSPRTEPPSPSRSEPVEATPESVTAVTINGFTAEVEGARVGRTLVGNSSPSRDFFVLRVKLWAVAARVPYVSWGRGKPKLIDSKGRELRHVPDDGAGGLPIGRYIGSGVDRGGIRDVLLFEPPASDSGELTLELPADCVDPEDAFIFVLQPGLWSK